MEPRVEHVELAASTLEVDVFQRGCGSSAACDPSVSVRQAKEASTSSECTAAVGPL